VLVSNARILNRSAASIVFTMLLPAPKPARPASCEPSRGAALIQVNLSTGRVPVTRGPLSRFRPSGQQQAFQTSWISWRIGQQLAVNGMQRHRINDRLGYHDAIERIAVMQRQFGDGCRFPPTRPAVRCSRLSNAAWNHLLRLHVDVGAVQPYF